MLLFTTCAQVQHRLQTVRVELYNGHEDNVRFAFEIILSIWVFGTMLWTFWDIATYQKKEGNAMKVGPGGLLSSAERLVLTLLPSVDIIKVCRETIMGYDEQNSRNTNPAQAVKQAKLTMYCLTDMSCIAHQAPPANSAHIHYKFMHMQGVRTHAKNKYPQMRP